MKQAKVRIIAGMWRSRKITFCADLSRPSPDRVRETLFNWLEPSINGATVLDLFAGSGVLAFEALSRGAKSAIAIDREQSCCRQILENRHKLQAILTVEQQDSFNYLQHNKAVVADVVFVDPPYAERLLYKSCELLERYEWLSEKAKIYLEDNQPIIQEQLPKGWGIIKSAKAGKVYYCIAQVKHE